jgi:hypothetical protein
VRNRILLAVLVSSLLSGFSPLFADPVIQRGIDVFTTPADGRSFFDFSSKPIPAGFFCKDSKAFTGRVAYRGLPLTTGAPGQLWGADTVIERLDDAAFDDKGVAVTRIRFRALSLVSIAPVKTACGDFHVYVSLAGKQRVTKMSILRTQEKGGNFVAPLAVDARVTFIPVKPARNHKVTRKLELTTSFTFPATPLPWSLTAGTQRTGPVAVDTDGDLAPDDLVSSTSNFAPGQSPSPFKSLSGGGCSCCPADAPLVCHLDSGEQHCTAPPACTNMASCC